MYITCAAAAAFMFIICIQFRVTGWCLRCDVVRLPSGLLCKSDQGCLFRLETDMLHCRQINVKVCACLKGVL